MNPLALESTFVAVEQTTYQNSFTETYIPTEGTIYTKFESTTKNIKEQQPKTFVYVDDLLKSKLFTNFNSNSRSLLLYIIYNLKQQKDFIKLTPRQIQKVMNISSNLYNKAIQELITEKIIYPKEITVKSEEYWINPHYVYNGSRLLYFLKNYPNQVIKVQGPPIILKDSLVRETIKKL